jgi:MFS transporter, PAT family, beta-lactamase induction signal transducer AmpG
MPTADSLHVGSPVPTTPPERPWLFGFLIAPVAVISNGVIGGALAYLLRSQGVNPAREGSIVALLTLPPTIYFLWSPVTDFWIRRRTWLMVAAVAGAVAMLAAFRQTSLSSSRAVEFEFLSACFGQLIVAACGGMMGTLQREATRRRASSFYQGGSLAFGALAVFVLVLLAHRLQLGALGWIAAAMIALPAFAGLAQHEERPAEMHGASETLARIWREFKGTFLRWQAIPYTLTITLPMGSGALIGLLPGLAADYRVSGQQVAWINGLGGAFLMAAGALSASLISTRVRAPVAYLLVCLANALSIAVLWLGPQRPMVYIAGVVLYLFTIGAAYALFTAVVLEFLGISGKSGSSRYAIINSLGNLPVAYMSFIDGRGYALWGPRGEPAVDALLSAFGGTALLTYFVLSRHSSAKKSDPVLG